MHVLNSFLKSYFGEMFFIVIEELPDFGLNFPKHIENTATAVFTITVDRLKFSNLMTS